MHRSCSDNVARSHIRTLRTKMARAKMIQNHITCVQVAKDVIYSILFSTKLPLPYRMQEQNRWRMFQQEYAISRRSESKC